MDAAHVLELVRVITEIFIAVVVVTGDGGDGHGAVLGEQHPLLLELSPVLLQHVLLGQLL